MMIIKAFDPSFTMSVDEWSEIAGFEEGKGTWANGSLVWLKNNGYDVKHIAPFDYERFVEKQGDYLIEYVGPVVGQWQIDHTNMDVEVERVKKLLAESTIIEKRIPTQDDIRHYLDSGYLLRAHVNSNKLNGKENYVGHAVVLFNYDEGGVYIHDPGLPPLENRYLAWDLFESAWADPNEDNKELDAVKKL